MSDASNPQTTKNDRVFFILYVWVVNSFKIKMNILVYQRITPKKKKWEWIFPSSQKINNQHSINHEEVLTVSVWVEILKLMPVRRPDGTCCSSYNSLSMGLGMETNKATYSKPKALEQGRSNNCKNSPCTEIKIVVKQSE